MRCWASSLLAGCKWCGERHTDLRAGGDKFGLEKHSYRRRQRSLLWSSPTRPSARRIMMDRRRFVRTTAAALAGLTVRVPHQDDWKRWRVDGARLNAHLAGLSRYGANPQGGVSRVAFSDADVAGRTYCLE